MPGRGIVRRRARRGGLGRSRRGSGLGLVARLSLRARRGQRVDARRNRASRRLGFPFLGLGRGNRSQVLGFLVLLLTQVNLDPLALAAGGVELVDKGLAGTQILPPRIGSGRARQRSEDRGGGGGGHLLGEPLRLLVDRLERARGRQTPVRGVLSCPLHEGHGDLPRFGHLAGRRPLQRRGIHPARCQAIENQVAHGRPSLADAHGARTRECIVLLRLDGGLETLHRSRVHPVLRRDLFGGRARPKECLNVARSERGTRRGDLDPRPVAPRGAAELVRDQHRVAFSLCIGQHQGLAIGAGPEQFELNHRFLLLRPGRIVSNYADNVA